MSGVSMPSWSPHQPSSTRLMCSSWSSSRASSADASARTRPSPHPPPPSRTPRLTHRRRPQTPVGASRRPPPAPSLRLPAPSASPMRFPIVRRSSKPSRVGASALRSRTLPAARVAHTRAQRRAGSARGRRSSRSGGRPHPNVTHSRRVRPRSGSTSPSASKHSSRAVGSSAARRRSLRSVALRRRFWGATALGSHRSRERMNARGCRMRHRSSFPTFRASHRNCGCRRSRRSPRCCRACSG